MSAELFGADPAVREASLKRVPMRRLGRPEDIANAVAFLCSEQARYITGIPLPVDGGWSALVRRPAERRRGPHEVTNVGNDRGQLSSMADQARSAMGKRKLDAIADRGYFSGPQIKAVR